MSNKVLSHLQNSSLRSSSPHIGPKETHIMTEGTSQRDQVGGMVREFKRGEVLAKLSFHLVTSPSSPWRRLEIAGSLQDWLDPQIHHTVEAQRQRALGEIATSMRRSPAPSSTCLSVEARHGFPAHGFAPDQPSPLLSTHNPVPGPDEPPPHPDPVPGPVLEGSQAEPPSHSVPVCEGLMDGLPPLSAPVPGPVLEGSEDELPPSLVPVPEEFVEDLETRLQCLTGSGANLHGLTEGPSGLRTAPLSSTMGSPGPTVSRQIIGSYITGLLSTYVTGLLSTYVASLLITCPYVANPLIAGLARDGPLIAGSAGDGLWPGCLNSGSAGDGLGAGCLNSGSAGDGLRASRLNSGSAGDGLGAGCLKSGSAVDGLRAGRLNSWYIGPTETHIMTLY
ncbi:hypothetical protein CRENBAI_004503 [Crenichthys baileyi]|uniref:Uncharacterized protein n=1 Tax=Crenichthys baileyi TaxID=28760 RepID=A0AAV9RGJ8_9TELE